MAKINLSGMDSLRLSKSEKRNLMNARAGMKGSVEQPIRKVNKM